MEVHKTILSAGLAIAKGFLAKYMSAIWRAVKDDPEARRNTPAMLVYPERVVMYFGQHHLAIEYVGPTSVSDYPANGRLELHVIDETKTEHFVDAILGFKYDGTSKLRAPLAGPNIGLYVPSNTAFDILQANKWNFGGESMILGMNLAGLEFVEGVGARLVNCFFYGTDDSGLIVRHIKWMDVFPLVFKDVDADVEEIGISFFPNPEAQATADAHFDYPEPTDFQLEKLAIVNRFVELFSKPGSTETDITCFLAQAEHRFILKMAFASVEIHHERKCEWADVGKEGIKPDFFLTQPNGYSDILEFKLPTLKSSPVVGRINRETFSAELNSYLSQTRVYREYFEDPRNRNWVKEHHSVDVLYPKRWLVVGRRSDFSSDDWRRIEADYRDLSIRTYDDVIDAVLSQLYS